MDLINSFFHFFTDNSKRITTKVFLFLSVIFLIWFLNDTLSFTFYYSQEKKLESMERINNLLKDKSLDESEIDYLIRTKKEIITRKPISELLINFLASREWMGIAKDFPPKVSFPDNGDINLPNPNSSSSNWNYYLHFISASFPWLILMLTMPFTAYSDKSMSFIKSIGVLLLAEFCFFIIALFFTSILGLVPIFTQIPWLNYLINFLVNISLIWYLIHLANKK